MLSQRFPPAKSEGMFLGVFSNSPIHEYPDNWPENSLYRLLTTVRSNEDHPAGSTVRITGSASDGFIVELHDPEGELLRTDRTSLDYVGGYLVGNSQPDVNMHLLLNVVGNDQMAFCVDENSDLISLRYSDGILLFVFFPVAGGGGGPPVTAVFKRQP